MDWEQYLSKFSDDIQKQIEDIKNESEKNGNADYEKCSRLMEAAIESDSNSLIGIAYYYLSQYYLAAGAKNDSKMSLLGCISYLHGKGPFEYIAKSYSLMGEVEKSQDNMVAAVEYYENGLNCCDENGIWEIKAEILNGIGSCYYRLNQEKEAVSYYQRALKIYQKPNEGERRIENTLASMVGMAECHLMLGQPEEAKKWKDKIVKLLDKVKRNHEQEYAMCLFFSFYYWEMKNTKEAQNYAEKAGNGIENNCRIGIYKNFKNYIQLLIRIQKYDSLEQVLVRLSASVEESKDRDLILYFLYVKIQYTADRMGEEELRKCIGRYFNLYNADVRDKENSVIQNLEARKQLRSMQEKQQELKIINQKLLSNSLHDALTGMPNRGYLNEHSEKIFERAFTKGYSCGICLIDIDFFKQLNDKYGHLEGDKCLKKIGSILMEFRSGKIFCARYGGDEFTIVMYHMSGQEIEEVLNGLERRVKEAKIPNEDSQSGPYVTLSIGCFHAIPDKGDKLWDFFSRADAALYQAKYLGKSRNIIWGKEKEPVQNQSEKTL